MIRYYYAELLLMSLGTEMDYRRPLFQPLFFEFPEDLNAYQALRYNIMLGPALKLSIDSDSVGVSSTNFYFPTGTWCDILHGNCLFSQGENYTLSSKAYDYYLHLREGYIIPYQNAKNLKIQTTSDL